MIQLLEKRLDLDYHLIRYTSQPSGTSFSPAKIPESQVSSADWIDADDLGL